MGKTQLKKLVKIWVVDMLKERWRKTNGQKMKMHIKKLRSEDKLGEGGQANLVLGWPIHERTKLGH